MAGHALRGNFSVGGLQRYAGTQILFTRSFITSPPGFYYRAKKVVFPTFFTSWKAISFFWKVAGVVERAALEMRWPGNWSGGSNPSLSAPKQLEDLSSGCFAFIPCILLFCIFLRPRMLLSSSTVNWGFTALHLGIIRIACVDIQNLSFGFN